MILALNKIIKSENYRSVLLMNSNAKILNKILGGRGATDLSTYNPTRIHLKDDYQFKKILINKK